MTLHEREHLISNAIPYYTGFTSRPFQHMTRCHRPHTSIDIECCHFLRTPSHEFTNQTRAEHRLWLEAGKSPPPFPVHIDPRYNSNTWRNFRQNLRLNFSDGRKRVDDTPGVCYGFNIPAPSQIGDNTLEKYIGQANLFKNENTKILALKKIRREIDEFKVLKCRTEARNPPYNEKGDILPPDNFKKYSHRYIPFPSPPPTPPPPGQKIDLFGQRCTPCSKSSLWKLSNKLNHPRFLRLKEVIRKKKEMSEKMKLNKANSQNSSLVLTSPSLSPSPDH